jgi:DNA (cytosine-5)-methyltransferase 1
MGERVRSTGEGRTYGVKLVRGPVLHLPEHPLACRTEHELLSLVTDLDRPRAADLFCGGGGLSLGLREAGFDVVLAVDHDDEALATHRAYHPGLSVNWDLGDADVVEKVARLVRQAGIQLVAGGPPCQPFSRAGRSMMRSLVRDGRRNHQDRRRDLWESFLGVVELSRPQAVIMENVPDMALDRGMIILRTIIERLERLGYSMEERVLDAPRFGVPQFRQRLILVALAKGRRFVWPEESDARVTVDAAIGDLPGVEGGWRPSNGDSFDPVASGWLPYEGPLTDFQRKAREGVAPAAEHRLYDHITRPVRADDAIAFASMGPETRYSDLDAGLKRYRDDIFDDKYKRLDPNNVSRTVTAHIAKDGYWYIHPYQDRTLTVREAARLQTFPDWVRFAGPPSAAFRQIGNAVPVVVARRVGEAVLRALSTGERAPYSTSRIAKELATWYFDHAPVRVPWLVANSRWQVVQAEMLWGRISTEHVVRAWASVRRLDTPDATIAALPLLRRMASQWQRSARCDQLAEAAAWFLQHPEALSQNATAEEMTAAPHVTKSIADLACRVVPGDSEDPVLAGYGVLRVAARFQGLPVDRQNRLSDGRLAIARMIGGDENSHEAHLALIELANGLCAPDNPRCGECPLVRWCVEAHTRPIAGSIRRITPMIRSSASFSPASMAAAMRAVPNSGAALGRCGSMSGSSVVLCVRWASVRYTSSARRHSSLIGRSRRGRTSAGSSTRIFATLIWNSPSRSVWNANAARANFVCSSAARMPHQPPP